MTNNGKIQDRINKKTGKQQYKCLVKWKDQNGKWHTTRTGWFDTEAKAIKESARLKRLHEEEAIESKENFQNKRIDELFDEYILELEKASNRSTARENTTSDKTNHKRALTIRSKYFPDTVKSVKLKNLDATDFRVWITYINKKTVSGSYTRNLRSLLLKFAKNYLADNGYIDSQLLNEIQYTLSTASIKESAKGKRSRHTPTLTDIQKLSWYYLERVKDYFEDLYWITLFNTLFFSGMRPEEAIGLTWDNVHIGDAEYDYFDIVNAISERELPSNVKRRMKAGNNFVKTKTSNRKIYMWKNLIPIFEDYKKQFMIQYEADQLKGMFVFPNISAKSIADRSDYQKQKNILRELNRACEAAGIEKTDVQCFRRGFATYLVSSPQEGGLGKFPEEVFQLLGHADAKMIHSIYGSLSKEANARKSVDALGLMFSKNEKYEEDPLIAREKEASEELINTALTKQNEEILFRLKVRKLVDQYNDEEITQDQFDELFKRVLTENLEAESKYKSKDTLSKE